MDFAVIQSLTPAEDALVDTLEATDVRHWSTLCSRFVLDMGTQLNGNPALAVGVVLHRIARIRRLPGSDVFPDPVDLRQTIERRYRRWQGEDMFAGLARDVDSWLSPGERRRKVVAIAQYVDAHLSERLTTGSIARRFGCSTRSLSTLFQEELGTTVREYVLRRRVRSALDLVRRGEKVEAAMLQVGYHNKTHFYRAFEMVTGQKPGRARVERVTGFSSNAASGPPTESAPDQISAL